MKKLILCVALLAVLVTPLAACRKTMKGVGQDTRAVRHVLRGGGNTGWASHPPQDPKKRGDMMFLCAKELPPGTTGKPFEDCVDDKMWW